MHLLAREEVGLRCLLQVAKRGRGAIPLPIVAIADAEGLSPEYAAKLLRRLRLGGLVTSLRGTTGGYRLARAPAEITVWDAIRVLDEDFLPESSCGCQPDQRGDCLRTTDCAVRSIGPDGETSELVRVRGRGGVAGHAQRVVDVKRQRAAGR